MPSYFDNTRLSAYKECPRYYYFRHIRHWRRKGLSAALGFGLGWHAGMDALWKGISENKDREQVVGAAMVNFDEAWVESGFPSWSDMDMETEQRYLPRTPGTAAEMFYAYYDKRAPMIRNMDLLGIEKPFCVAIFRDDTDIWYVGRRDKDVRFQGRVLIIEHKTTALYKKDGFFRSDYIDGWSVNSQCDGYLHSGHMDYGSKMGEVWVDAALVHKTVHNGFKFIPVDRMVSQLDGWLYDVRNWIDRVRIDTEALRKYRELVQSNDHFPHLPAFPKQTEQCIGKYGKCGYHDICRFNSNPESITEPPEGFIEEKWEPFEVLNLASLGRKAETKEEI